MLDTEDAEDSPTNLRHVYQVKCALSVQGANGAAGKKLHCKEATVTVGRNEFRDILLHIVFNGNSVGNRLQISYRLSNCRVHHRFVKEGRAGVTVIDQKLDILLSNCAPHKLNVFMKTLDAKLKLAAKPSFNNAKQPQPPAARTPSQLSARQRLLSDLPQIFEKLSPLTLVEMHTLRPNVNRPLGDATNRPANATGGGTPVRCKRPLAASSSTAATKLTPTGKSSLKKRRLSSEALSPVQPKQQLQRAPGAIQLTDEQKSVLRAVLAGKSMFFTGSAGTGKSLLLTRIIGMLPADSTFVTAATGVAACHIGGVTVHAFAGIGGGEKDLEACVQLASRPNVAAQWRKCKHLVVDEISMIDAEFFTKLEHVARTIRRNEQPFGGIQLILCGDFAQLPPVVPRGQQTGPSFCFQSRAWQRSVNTCLLLRQIHRQADRQFIRILNEVRYGRVSSESSALLLATREHVLDSDGVLATRLCTHKSDANNINATKLGAIPGPMREFQASDSELIPSRMDIGCPSNIQLKVGAQVMLTKNLDLKRGLSNGARGVVSRFDEKTGRPVVRFGGLDGADCDQVISAHRHIIRLPTGCVVTRTQLPLQLAWAISIHKSQGLSLDRVEISLARVFECGQAYVALSRARSLKGLRVVDFDRASIRAHPSVVEFYAQLGMH